MNPTGSFMNSYVNSFPAFRLISRSNVGHHKCRYSIMNTELLSEHLPISRNESAIFLRSILLTSDGSFTNSKIANHFGIEGERITFEYPPTLYSSFTKWLEYFCNATLFLFHIWMNIEIQSRWDIGMSKQYTNCLVITSGFYATSGKAMAKSMIL